jgi:hypothetical protein
MSSVDYINPNEKSVLQRNVADFHPSVWGDFFIPYASESMVRNSLNQQQGYIYYEK